jgi:hypothetical protein
VVVLIDLVAGKLAAQDLCERVVGVVRGHDVSPEVWILLL